jgi:hypothetical protein
MILTSKHEIPWTDEEPQTNAKNAYVCATCSKNAVVIYNPNAVDKGTVFVPTNGRAYFNGLQ